MRFAPSLAFCLWGGAAMAACPGQTQVELNACAAQEYQQADAVLNAAWGPAKSVADSAGMGEVLLDAQRKWLAFRDAACSAEAGLFQGGSIQPLVWYSCLTRLTVARTEDLYNIRF